MLLKASPWADLIAVFRPSATPGSWRAETKKDVLAARGSLRAENNIASPLSAKVKNRYHRHARVREQTVRQGAAVTRE